MLGVRINSVFFTSNFRKFIIGGLKSEFCMTTLKEENHGLTYESAINIVREIQYSRKKIWLCKDIELMCTYNNNNEF